MNDPRNRPDDRPSPASQPPVDDLRELLGEEEPDEQDAAITIDEVERARIPTMTELDEGASTIPDRRYAAEGTDPDVVSSLDEAADSELRDGETDDPLVAIEEGQVYVPPSDPPTVPSDDPQGIDVAGGTGVESTDERYDDDHGDGGELDEGDVNGRIRDAIRNDAATSLLADRLEIAVVGSTAILRGVVDDVSDGDALATVIEQVDGIDEVRDETEVASLG
jgi:hypothetical protein